MADACTVLIAAPDLLPALKERTAEDGAVEVLAFTDTDALKALGVITKRRPTVVALERMFASTPRGTALINRIKADPSLADAEIRVISRDEGEPGAKSGPGVATAPAATATATAPAATATAAAAAATAAPPTAAPPAPAEEPAAPQKFDTGTRRAPRFKIGGQMDMVIDGKGLQLVDLSACGAQVISPTILKPKQRVRVGLGDDKGNLRFTATIAWALFEIFPNSGPRYRAGINFVDPDAKAIDAYIERHKA